MLLFVDGIDGAGKSSLINVLHERFLDEDFQYYEHYEHEIKVFGFPSQMPGPEDRKDELTRTMFHLNDFLTTMGEHRTYEKYQMFDRSFVTTMAYQGFNDQKGDELLNHRFDSIFRLGAEALISSPTDYLNPKKVFFLHVKCDPEEAATRVLDRTTDREGDIEQIKDRGELVERLATLQDRYNICYAHTRMHLHRILPQNQYIFLEVDTTDQNTNEIQETIIGHIKPLIWPPQMKLF